MPVFPPRVALYIALAGLVLVIAGAVFVFAVDTVPGIALIVVGSLDILLGLYSYNRPEQR